MATLMLTSLGSALGGPLGAAIGGLVGQSIDRSLFGALARRGPRLGDLSVQTSSYGSMVPRLYGKMRVAGTVIWATDLKEGGELQSGGKGQPDALTYSYSVSLAVALSSRPLQGIGRIWADGQLLRGSAGDFKVKTKFRFYSGDEDQPADPLIASIEGIDATPAYRGLALAVFEDLQLAAFGNRIPVLTFEIEADEGSATIGDILADVSSGCIAVDEPRTVDGYAAYGQSAEEACSPLIEGYDLELHNEGLRLVGPAGAAATKVEEAELGCSIEGEGAPRTERSQGSAAALPAAVSLTFYDASREYQTGEQSATSGGHSRTRQRLELPAVLPAADAKSLAEAKLARSWIQRDLLKLRLPPGWLGLAPGDVVHLEGGDQQWRARKIVVDGLVVTAELVQQSRPVGVSKADPGRIVAPADRIAEPTIVALIELPGGDKAAGPHVYIAATGGRTPWRPVPVQLSGPAFDLTTSTARNRAVMGSVTQVAGPCGSALLDLDSSLEVQLFHSDNWLNSCEDEGLAAGANLALVGNELLQFGSAVALGDNRFRLSRLLRGRGGSEWAVASHEAGERFILLDPAALTRISVPLAAMNTAITAVPLGLADGDGSSAKRLLTGEGIRPPSPVHLNVARAADGGATVTWVRRSRLGWTWNDEVEVPLGEARELYRVRASGSKGTIERTTAETACRFEASELLSIGAAQMEVAVAQLGDFGASREAIVQLIA